MFDLTPEELAVLTPLRTPERIQDFLGELPMNEEKDGDTCLSPRRVLRERHAHCIEGAMLAALALRLHGHRPLLMDLKTTKHDFDHVVALFQYKNHWGAISKTNHAVLRYRDPIYKNVRELALSYFHEYFLDDGTKTLRSYSVPFDLSRLDRKDWMTSDEDVWFVPIALDDAKHVSLFEKNVVRKLRSADDVERMAGKIVEWRGGKNVAVRTA